MKLYLQCRLELTCNQDLRVICTCVSGKLNHSSVSMKIAELDINTVKVECDEFTVEQRTQCAFASSVELYP